VKLLIAIFSFYVLLLPAVPCSDNKECRENAAAAKAASGNPDHHDEESCNPFCNCNCCGQVFTPVFQVNRTAITRPVSQKQHYFYKDIFISPDFLGTIWQPPRV
jgi:hypothetical protein